MILIDISDVGGGDIEFTNETTLVQATNTISSAVTAAGFDTYGSDSQAETSFIGKCTLASPNVYISPKVKNLRFVLKVV